MLVKMREQEASCRRFDNTPDTRKHRATELFNERHGLSALFCSGFLARCRLVRTNLPSMSALALMHHSRRSLPRTSLRVTCLNSSTRDVLFDSAVREHFQSCSPQKMETR